MAACEKCWRDANARAMHLGGTVSDHYHALLEERRDNPCGQDAVGDDADRYLAPPQSEPTARPVGPWSDNADAREPVK